MHDSLDRHVLVPVKYSNRCGLDPDRLYTQIGVILEPEDPSVS